MKKHLWKGLFLLLLLPMKASGDPCAAKLGSVDPGGAAAIMAHEGNSRQRADRLEDHALGNDGDAQFERKDASKILRVAAEHHDFETPLYAAGIGMALAKGDFATAATLSLCVQKRSAQSGADKTAADKNQRGGEKATNEDQNNSYDPRVIVVDQPKNPPPASEQISAHLPYIGRLP